MGDIQHASTDASQIPLTMLRSAYTAGFNTLLQLLAMFTLFTATVVFLFLGRQGEVYVGVDYLPRYFPSCCIRALRNFPGDMPNML
ncbi:hypothetical protein D3C80_2103270 [compost metagenome]